MKKFGMGQAVRRVEDQRLLAGGGRLPTCTNSPGPCAAGLVPVHQHAALDQRPHKPRIATRDLLPTCWPGHPHPPPTKPQPGATDLPGCSHWRR